MRRIRHRRRCTRGFTLVEALLAIVVIGAMVAATGNLLITGMDTYRLVVDRSDALQRARFAMNFMTNEFEIIEDPTNDIASITAGSITFTPAGGGSVTYQAIGNDVYRNGDLLVEDIDLGQSGLEYFTAGGATTSDPAQVYRIRVTLTVDAADASAGEVTLVSNVYLRNRYYESFTRL